MPLASLEPLGFLEILESLESLELLGYLGILYCLEKRPFGLT